MKGVGSAEGTGHLEMARSLVPLRSCCLEASELHTPLPTLWSEGENIEWAKRNETEAGEPGRGAGGPGGRGARSEKLNAENRGPRPEILILVGGEHCSPRPWLLLVGFGHCVLGSV